MRLVVMLALLATVLGAGCSKTRKTSVSDTLPGRQVYEVKNCTRCHGVDAEGGTSAPSLRFIGHRLSKEQIVEFLKDPALYTQKDARLAGQAGKYPTRMPGFPFMAPADLERLAEYLLALN